MKHLVAPIALLLASTSAWASPTPVPSQDETAYDVPFFEGARYDPAIPTPDSILGVPHASRLSHHEEILACFERWVEASARIRVQPYGSTHEGRELVYAVITSPANHARLDAIRADVARLADPRGLDQAEAERIVTTTPPIAWMGYSIHGDETSGADAAVALGYHLVASTDASVAELLDSIVVVIDPVMNPDGRERIVGMVEQSSGVTPSLDWESMHRGRWPYGRGNHYLFDMNRDWMAGTQPETRGRWHAVLSFHPQLFVDAHEMGSLETFLFYPQEEPHNPHLPESLDRWHGVFGAGIADAFDRQGWAYYTREWADGWGPFYSDAWGSLGGAIGILYEQARTFGKALRQASGRILTYREAVHHQATASLANLETLADNAEPILRDYLAHKRRAVAADTPGNDRMFVATRGTHPQREAELVRILTGQAIEVFRTSEAFRATDAVDRFGERHETLEVPAGSLVVPARQPMRALVRAYLEFDPRMDRDALQAEREDLERRGETRIYDLTSWSLPHALDVACWWTDVADVGRELVTSSQPVGSVEAFDPATPPFGWLAGGDDDASVAFAGHAMELGLQVHVADEPFQSGDVAYPRGSVLVRRDDNPGTVAEVAARIATAAGRARATVRVAASGRSPDDGPDMGGGHFHLLARPRVALVSNAPFAPDTYGHLWYHVDQELGLPLAILDAQRLSGYDLRRYNVLILPRGWGGVRSLLEPMQERLATWVRGGGTLIACGNAAAALTHDALGLSDVTLRRHALDELERYRTWARREREAREVTIDEALVWNDPRSEDEAFEAEETGDDGTDEASEEEKKDDEEEEVHADEDAWLRRFSPHGVTLRGMVDDGTWITVGVGAEMPVYSSGSRVFLAREPVQTAVRLAAADALRLGGLVWPEARERLEQSAWLTVESKGNGQVVLFASMPAFRGYHRATARLLSNAIVFGPGIGASQPIGW